MAAACCRKAAGFCSLKKNQMKPMRENIFKAKRINWNSLPKELWPIEWVEGNLVLSQDAVDGWEAIIIPTKNSDMFAGEYGDTDVGFDNWFRVDSNTICQYTGRKDKNANKIWEGNIFQASDGENMQKYIITWNNDFLQWYAKCPYDEKKSRPLCKFREDEIDVIGNIFDNADETERMV